MHVQGLDEDACKQIVAMEGLLDHFGIKTKAHKREQYQQLAESQAMHAELVKDVHDLWQFTIVKLASCMSNLNSLDCELQNYRSEVAQTSAKLEALEKCVAVMEDVLVHAGLWELRTELQGTKEEIGVIWGKWEEVIVKLQGFD